MRKARREKKQKEVYKQILTDYAPILLAYKDLKEAKPKEYLYYANRLTDAITILIDDKKLPFYGCWLSRFWNWCCTSYYSPLTNFHSIYLNDALGHLKKHGLNQKTDLDQKTQDLYSILSQLYYDLKNMPAYQYARLSAQNSFNTDLLLSSFNKNY